MAQEKSGPNFRGEGTMANQSLNISLLTSMVLVETSRMLVPWASRALASAYPIMPISWNARPRWWYPSCHVGDSCTAVLGGAEGEGGGRTPSRSARESGQRPRSRGGVAVPILAPRKPREKPPPPLPPVEPRGPVRTWRQGGPRGRS